MSQNINDLEKTAAGAQSGEASDEISGRAIYFAGSVLALLIALAKGSDLFGAIGYGILSWLYVLYAIIALIFGG